MKRPIGFVEYLVISLYLSVLVMTSLFAAAWASRWISTMMHAEEPSAACTVAALDMGDSRTAAKICETVTGCIITQHDIYAHIRRVRAKEAACHE